MISRRDAKTQRMTENDILCLFASLPLCLFASLPLCLFAPLREKYKTGREPLWQAEGGANDQALGRFIHQGLFTKVDFANLLILGQIFSCVGQDEATCFQNISPMSNLQRLSGILLDQQDR